ncbi:MAG: hypothetical protein JWQ74_2708 [Marmoricola sp.]|nr:hypothetical protein [Marmoricola sp.]
MPGMSALVPTAPCPCGTGTSYDGCCGPLHRNERQALSAEQLMRSRYSAYAVGALDHLFRSWHPRTRPEDVRPDDDLTWTGLDVLGVEEDGDSGTVEFRAHWTWNGQTGALHERSRFTRRAGRWVYVEGEES